ncbi:MAG: J domain-containing protein [Rhodospirillales bacterium]|nr:J domain-containing protein [Rhodospirillales bacterium]
MQTSARKVSYTIPCSSAFRDAVEALAARRKVNVADVARSVLLVFPAALVAAFPDPGEPLADDRESIVLKSGSAEGRPWRRKPRVQIRMAAGFDIPAMRRALGIALALARNEAVVRLETGAPPNTRELGRMRDEIEQLRSLVGMLSFDPLPQGVKTADEALHVLGFPPGERPDAAAMRARFRTLATIHHPDGPYGNHMRMSQLNSAMEILRRGA